ncbi:MAG: hypothetical protein R6V28_15010 [Nitriliruptoraceae bacterium]
MGALQVMIGLYATVLPFAVLGAWIAVALWDLSRRVGAQEVGRSAAVGWSLAVLVVPVVGAAGYLLSTPSLPRWLAATYVGGGLLAWLAVLGVTAGLGAAG